MGTSVDTGSWPKQKPAGMDREVAREVLDLARELEEVACGRRLGIERRVAQRGGAGLLAVRVQLGEPVERRLRDAQHLADVAHRRARAVPDHVGDHRRMLAAVLFVDVLDHLLTPLVHDVEIDVGRLRTLLG